MSELTEIERALDQSVRSQPDQSPIAAFILKYGRYFVGEPLPAGIKRGHLQECYANAAMLALKDDPAASYAEGYAYKSDLLSPFLHAWCVRDGRVLDNTLHHPEDFDYFGIVISKAKLIENERATGTYGVLTGELGSKFMEEWKTSAAG